MPITNKEVAAVLDEIALYMQLDGENPFKTRSYTNGARLLESLEEDINTLVAANRLRELKGVGEALEQKITELVQTGRLEYLENLKRQFPPMISELFEISGLGPKRIKQVYDELQVGSLADLEAACTSGTLATLKGFSEKMQAKVLEGIAFARQHQGQFHINKALEAATPILQMLRNHQDVLRVELAGSLRRRKEIIKDIDLVASSNAPKPVMDAFVGMPEVAAVTGHGDTKSSVRLKSGISADLRVVTDAQFPFALAHFTGSKEHNVAMRQRAKDRMLKLNEYGLHREDESILPCNDEQDIFKALGLPFLPPEIREDRGEFDVAQTPRLVERADLRGCIHNHTTYSDGHNTLEEMVAAAQAEGYEYLHISDHSQTASYAGGLKPEAILRQHQEIDALQKRLSGFRILKGIESDILNDGSLDYDDAILASFDLVIASVHSKLEMTEPEATKRIIAAIENPFTRILGHPTGRLLLARPGYTLNMDKVFDACVANRVAVEINGNAKRLDVDWRLIRQGRDKGVLFSIGPDAHRVQAYKNVDYGVGIARKGWLGPEHILNCMSAEELLAWAKR
ncbi:MAG: DNA polymerase/3'-5' exonuclease PolX [Candidatus Hydrogenedentes bacterium]|nr:DNA polymerase/3'-5' exonuclease PolX [Candidatus Hydrogenedentota bacterium]